jgi:hypothetical protein
MTILDPSRLAGAFRRAAVRATLAPSVYNTQPWRLHLGPARLGLFPDRDRQLSVHDPAGRQLVIGCGCALFNARISLAADGVPIAVHRFPGGVAVGEACAVISADGASAVDDSAISILDKSVESRRTNTRPFTTGRVPDDLFDQLRDAAAQEDARLLLLNASESDFADAQLRQAVTVMQLDPAYRAELRAWGGTHTEQPSSGSRPGSPSAERSVLIATDHDRPSDWLRAGEALERVLLEVSRAGYAAGLSGQIAEVPSVRTRLRRGLRLDGYPHVLLRIGVAPASPETRRRRLSEMITIES